MPFAVCKTRVGIAKVAVALRKMHGGSAEVDFALRKTRGGRSEQAAALRKMRVRMSEVDFAACNRRCGRSEQAVALRKMRVGYAEVDFALRKMRCRYPAPRKAGCKIDGGNRSPSPGSVPASDSFTKPAMFVTYAVVNIWTGIKQTGNDPTGTTRVTGCDPLATLAVEAQ